MHNIEHLTLADMNVDGRIGDAFVAYLFAVAKGERTKGGPMQLVAVPTVQPASIPYYAPPETCEVKSWPEPPRLLAQKRLRQSKAGKEWSQ